MPTELLAVLFAAGLSTLGVAVGWLTRTTISNSRRVAILEERSRGHEEALSRIGRVHQRIDDVAASTSHIDGQLTQLNRSVGLLTEHLLNREGSAS